MDPSVCFEYINLAIMSILEIKSSSSGGRAHDTFFTSPPHPTTHPTIHAFSVPYAPPRIRARHKVIFMIIQSIIFLQQRGRGSSPFLQGCVNPTKGTGALQNYAKLRKKTYCANPIQIFDPIKTCLFTIIPVLPPLVPYEINMK